MKWRAHGAPELLVGGDGRYDGRKGGWMARGIWKGTLGFGLVNIGVELFTAEQSHALDLDMLDARDHGPIGYRKYNKNTGQEVEGSQIVKGFQVAKGRYVILEQDELKAASPRKTQSIDVVGFVPAADIPLVYFDKPYVVGPLKGSEKAYALFVRTLEEMEQVGIAQVVIRTKQHIAAIYPYQQALVAQLLRYHDEVRQPEQLGIERGDAQAAALRPPELTMARQLVEMMRTEWRPEEFRDTYRDDVMRLVEEKAAGGTVSAAAPDESEPRVLDLVTALKGSLAARARESLQQRRGATPARSKSAVKAEKVVKPSRKVASKPRAKKTGS
jgi:DNA end-binding protein Ku